jgi:hypothetical protein
MNRRLLRRSALVVAGLTVVALTAGIARAVFPDDAVATYAGCLNADGGTVVSLAPGDAPMKSCKAGQVLVHLGGGDITSVNAGPGLTGGSENGATTLALAQGQSLPQTCFGAQVPKWNGAGWSCGDDEDHVYGAGAGLDLNGSDDFSVKGSYQLPQGCAKNQIPKWDGNAWTCATDAGSASAWSATGGDIELPADGSLRTITQLALPEGKWAIFANQYAGTDNTSADTTFIDCDLRVDGNLIQHVDVHFGGAQTRSDVVELGIADMGTSGVANVRCEVFRDQYHVFTSRIVAIPLNAVQPG